MEFSEVLNNYISKTNSTVKELSNLSGVSASLISKYRTGVRVPKANSEQIIKLSNSIHLLNNELKESIIKKELIESINKDYIDNSILTKNFNELITLFNINISEIAKFLCFDASYLSKIRCGKRTPADSKQFAKNISKYIISHYNNETDLEILLKLLNANNEKVSVDNLYKWLTTNTKNLPNEIDNFLKKLDDFNLNEYIKVIHFDEIKVPSLPFQFHNSKNYYELSGMKNAELDFFKTTILAKNNESTFMCSDMPMEDMAEDIDFGKKWMYAIAISLKKGLKFNVIHNINRPFNEMMLGLESWIPIYMTGQISPYYLPGTNNSNYCHLTYVSGTCALSGECIKGKHKNGKYYLTSIKDEVQYYRNKSIDLLNRAQPLIQIYRKESSNLFNASMLSEISIDGKRHNILSSLPIHTLTDELLLEILKYNKVDEKNTKKILEYYKAEKNNYEFLLKNNIIIEEIPNVTKNEFNKYPLTLSLSKIFYDTKIYYNYDQFMCHLNKTRELSIINKNYNLIINKNNTFKNIQIYIRDEKWVLISKDDNPTIHFIIKHPKLCSAIEKFVAPIKEK